MCTKDQRIESKVSLFNRTKSKIRVTLLQQILNASRWKVTEIVCKTIRQKMYVVFYNMNCSKCSVNLDEHHHASQSILASENWFCIFHTSCTMYCTFHCVLSHCNFRVSHHIYVVLVTDCTRKQRLLTKLFNFALTKDVQLISQSNVQAVKAEKEEWYTLSNIINIKLQNHCFFLWGLF